MITDVRKILVAVVLLAYAGLVQAQPKIPLVTRLAVASNPARIEAFHQGLRDIGYLVGKNITVQDRDAGADFKHIPGVTADILRLKPDVIVTAGTIATRAVKDATVKIPIVMSNDSDPVDNGVIASLARPGGNITGLSNFAPELGDKRLEILREVVPQLARVAVLGTSTTPGYAQMSRELDAAAKAFGMAIQHLDLLDSKDIERAFRAAKKELAQGIIIMTSPLLDGQRQRARIIELAERNKLPAMYPRKEWVNDGGLMYYGVNILDLDRRSAVFVKKILEGAHPGDLPVEQPTKFGFLINLKTAKQIGLTIPQSTLMNADRVIK